jgi:hypothetical protein
VALGFTELAHDVAQLCVQLLLHLQVLEQRHDGFPGCDGYDVLRLGFGDAAVRLSVISIIEGRVFKESAGSKGKRMSQAPASMLA